MYYNYCKVKGINICIEKCILCFIFMVLLICKRNLKIAHKPHELKFRYSSFVSLRYNNIYVYNDRLAQQ